MYGCAVEVPRHGGISLRLRLRGFLAVVCYLAALLRVYVADWFRDVDQRARRATSPDSPSHGVIAAASESSSPSVRVGGHSRAPHSTALETMERELQRQLKKEKNLSLLMKAIEVGCGDARCGGRRWNGVMTELPWRSRTQECLQDGYKANDMRILRLTNGFTRQVHGCRVTSCKVAATFLACCTVVSRICCLAVVAVATCCIESLCWRRWCVNNAVAGGSSCSLPRTEHLWS